MSFSSPKENKETLRDGIIVFIQSENVLRVYFYKKIFYAFLTNAAQTTMILRYSKHDEAGRRLRSIRDLRRTVFCETDEDWGVRARNILHATN
jgi:hypothetical protein